MKTVCIYHSIDLDGWMSAAIVRHWFNQQEIPNKINESPNTIDFIGYNYGQSIPDLSEYDKVIMCDISFPSRIMKELHRKLTAIPKEPSNFIWLDHHISAIKDMENEYPIGNSVPISMPFGLRDTNYAACELTWKYFFPNNTMPEIVRLLGRYDCFGHKLNNYEKNRLMELRNLNPLKRTDLEHNELCKLEAKITEERKVLEFQYSARLRITNYEDAYYYLDIALRQEDKEMIENVIRRDGITIYKYLCTEAKQVYKNGFPIYFRNDIKIHEGVTENGIYKFITINRERFNPINFGIDYHKDGYDGCACFWYANNKWNFSLYNDNGLVDCSIIAKQFGGGGHKGAAGFMIDDINKIINYG